MSQSEEYRRYASECIESARTAASDDTRKQFLEMAKMWMTAASQMDGFVAPSLLVDDKDKPFS